MKKFFKLFISVFLIFSLVLLTQVGESYATDNLPNDKKLSNSDVKITIVNDQSGATRILDLTDVVVNEKINLNGLYDESIVVGYDIFIPLEDLNSIGITPLDVGGGTKTTGGVTAELYVNYDVSLNNEQVRVNRVDRLY